MKSTIDRFRKLNNLNDDGNLSAFESVSADELTNIDGGNKPVVKHEHVEYLKIRLTDVIVASYRPHGEC